MGSHSTCGDIIKSVSSNSSYAVGFFVLQIGLLAKSSTTNKESITQVFRGVAVHLITIIDFGMGNLGSIKNMLVRMNYKAQITSDLETIRHAEKLILPGVGAFDVAMTNLKNQGLIPVLNELVLEHFFLFFPVHGHYLSNNQLIQRVL